MTIYLHCDDNPTLTSWTKKIYLLEADKRLGLNVFKDYGECSDMHPQYVLNIQPADFHIFRGFKWTGIWHIDVQMEPTTFHQRTQYTRLYPTFDTVFVASSSGLVHHPGEQLLFQAADPVIHRRNSKIVQEYDFVACGSYVKGIAEYDERVRQYDILKKEFSFHDFGKGFPPKAYVNCLSAAKVLWVQGMISKQNKQMAAQRFFESLAIGPMLCAWNMDIPLTGLVENEDFMCYGKDKTIEESDKEMVEKMKLLLSDKNLRNKIAENGRRKALLYHTYEQRAMAIYNIVREFANA